jgi:hypothetical protein
MNRQKHEIWFNVYGTYKIFACSTKAKDIPLCGLIDYQPIEHPSRINAHDIS